MWNNRSKCGSYRYSSTFVGSLHECIGCVSNFELFSYELFIFVDLMHWRRMGSKVWSMSILLWNEWIVLLRIRPSTKEAFDSARDGPPTPSSLHPLHPPINTFTPITPMGGLHPPPVQRLNLFTMPLIKPSKLKGFWNVLRNIFFSDDNVMGHNRRGREGMEMGRGEFRRRDDSPSRGRREERRKRYNIHLLDDDASNFRSISPRSKKPRGDRICVHISNLPFRVKESEIRR